MQKKLQLISATLAFSAITIVAASATEAEAKKSYKLNTANKLVNEKTNKLAKGYVKYNTILYLDGRIFKGFYYKNGKYYKNGVIHTGMVGKKYYVKGLLANGVHNNMYYSKGVIAKGLKRSNTTYYYDGTKANGKYVLSGEKKYFENGKIIGSATKVLAFEKAFKALTFVNKEEPTTAESKKFKTVYGKYEDLNKKEKLRVSTSLIGDLKKKKLIVDKTTKELKEIKVALKEVLENIKDEKIGDYTSVKSVVKNTNKLLDNKETTLSSLKDGKLKLDEAYEKGMDLKLQKLMSDSLREALDLVSSFEIILSREEWDMYWNKTNNSSNLTGKEMQKVYTDFKDNLNKRKLEQTIAFENELDVLANGIVQDQDMLDLIKDTKNDLKTDLLNIEGSILGHSSPAYLNYEKVRLEFNNNMKVLKLKDISVLKAELTNFDYTKYSQNDVSTLTTEINKAVNELDTYSLNIGASNTTYKYTAFTNFFKTKSGFMSKVNKFDLVDVTNFQQELDEFDYTKYNSDDEAAIKELVKETKEALKTELPNIQDDKTGYSNPAYINYQQVKEAFNLKLSEFEMSNVIE